MAKAPAASAKSTPAPAAPAVELRYEDRPDLLPDIVFGAAACLHLDDAVADHMRRAFEDSRSSLREPARG